MFNNIFDGMVAQHQRSRSRKNLILFWSGYVSMHLGQCVLLSYNLLCITLRVIDNGSNCKRSP